MKKELKFPSGMTIKELHDLINWAESEISEYQSLIIELKNELENISGK